MVPATGGSNFFLYGENFYRVEARSARNALICRFCGETIKREDHYWMSFSGFDFCGDCGDAAHAVSALARS